MHPLVRDLLGGVARAGARAGLSALDSLFADAQEVTQEITDRVQTARARGQRIKGRVKKNPKAVEGNER